MKEGTTIMMFGENRLIESHWSSGIPFPTRMIPAPSFRTPKKYASPAIKRLSMVVISWNVSPGRQPAQIIDMYSL